MDRLDDDPWDGRDLGLLSRDELEAVIRVRSSELEGIVEAMADLLLKLDADGRIELANGAVETVLGHDPDALVGKPLDMICADNERSADLLADADFVGRIVQDGVVSDIEIDLVTASGRSCPMSLSVSVIRKEGTAGSDVTDDIDGFVCVAKDISDRIERERRRKRQSEKLELLNRSVLHDVHNDVNLLLELVRKIQRDAPPPDEPLELSPERRKYFEPIEETGHRIAELIEIARNLTRTSAELGEDREAVALRRVLRREIANLDTISREVQIEVRGDIPDVDVLANEMLVSVFRNVFTNAVRHNDNDEPSVIVSTSLTDETVTVRIADNGPGLSETKQAELETGEVSLPSSGTSGFGLYIVTTLLEQYGGDLRIEDTEPHGTTFEVTLERAGRDEPG